MMSAVELRKPKLKMTRQLNSQIASNSRDVIRSPSRIILRLESVMYNFLEYTK